MGREEGLAELDLQEQEAMMEREGYCQNPAGTPPNLGLGTEVTLSVRL